MWNRTKETTAQALKPGLLYKPRPSPELTSEWYMHSTDLKSIAVDLKTELEIGTTEHRR